MHKNQAWRIIPCEDYRRTSHVLSTHTVHVEWARLYTASPLLVVMANWSSKVAVCEKLRKEDRKEA